MPAYTNNYAVTPRIVKQLVLGKPEFLIGNWPDNVALGRFIITNLVGSGTAVTVTGAMIEGNVPAIGDLISIHATTADSGNLNSVASAKITAVSLNAAGVGTIQFSSSETFASTPDSGLAVIMPQITSESLTASGALVLAATIPVAVQESEPAFNKGRTITVNFFVDTNTQSTTLTANLQEAMIDLDSEYVNINSTPDFSFATTITGGQTKQYTLQGSRLYRLKLAATSGTGASTGHAEIM